ncbi:hypothetical protein [Streptomyces sp. CC208A]|uniref:hypothetical protein n=1 Tax=Streptomyces sp. CC208A TaxID=3044573 RepID=UPI0024A7DCFF|nr:hypothetical protein [Streptomyces sp. CC208A]
MSLLDVYRGPARELLTVLAGTSTPEWRVCSEEAAEELSSIAPVCTDEEHDPDDAWVYPCCPEPVIECHSSAMADYLTALLNADRSKS